MNKFSFFSLVAIYFLCKASVVSANTHVVSSSGLIKKRVSKHSNLREVCLTRFLEKHNSPLATYADKFIFYADKYRLDYRLVPAISGVESSFGKRIPKGSFNAYGWANGKYYFESWELGIEEVSKVLRKNYYDQGATNLTNIGRLYAPPSKTWAWKVKYFMKKIDPMPLDFTLDN